MVFPVFVRRILAPAAGVVALFSVGLSDASRARAQEDEGPSLHALVLSADLIVVGKIVRTTKVDRENDLSDISYNHRKRYTAVIATIKVDDTLKGDAGETVKFTYPEAARVEGEPVYDPGDDGVWLLRKAEKRDEYVADEIGRLQPRERKEQIRAILTAAKSSNAAAHDGDDAGTK